jgi:hypothetical protein
MKLYKFIFLMLNMAFLFFIYMQFSSCESSTNKGEKNIQSTTPHDTNGNTSAMNTPHFSSENLEVKTYEVKDSTGKSQGWGYDIYVGNKKTIHQPIIPAIPGNRSFKTENDAMKTGLFALQKMKKESSLPTLLIKELDSLGVTK